MLEKYEICSGLFHGFDYAGRIDGASTERVSLLPGAQEHILAQENGKERCLRAVRELSQAFALAVPHAEAMRIRDEVAFFQAVRSVLAKRAGGKARPEEELDYAIRQIVSRAVASEGVIDIFAAAGLEKPDISILSEEFLAEVRGMKQRNLAVELLQKLLKGELAIRRRKNVVQARSFAEMLEQTVRSYANRAIEAAQVIEELIQLARGHARSECPWRGVGALRGRTRLLRCARGERQRRAGSSATRRYAILPASWSTPCETTSRSTGHSAKTCARTCAGWSSASCGDTATRPTSRRGRRGRCSNKRRCSRRGGWDEVGQ